MEQFIQSLQDFMVVVRCYTYNHSAYITDALNGFIIQQTNFPFVIVLVDDASTDGEQTVIRDLVNCQFDINDTSIAYEIETEYAHVTFAQHRINRNCYIAVYLLKENHHSQKKPKALYLKPWREKCKYEALCEGDDYWIDSHKLQKQVDFMEENPEYSLCGTNGWVKYFGVNKKDILFNNINVSRELNPDDIIGHWVFPTAGLLFKKDISDEIYNFKWKIYSGDLTLVLISMNRGKIYAFSDICCVYRRDIANTNSVSMTVRREKSRAYVITQHILLYNGFNNYTNKRYDCIIGPLLVDLFKKEKVYKMMDKSVLLAALCYPMAFARIVLNKFMKNRK